MYSKNPILSVNLSMLIVRFLGLFIEFNTKSQLIEQVMITETRLAFRSCSLEDSISRLYQYDRITA
jgi:hypothetical protein